MELWVRSQDKGMLIKVNEIYIDRNFDEIVKKYVYDIRINDFIVGNYETEKRALEVLDEIQSKIKNQYIVEFDTVASSKDMRLVDNVLNIRYNGEFIIQPQTTKLHPVNSGVIIYEMPKE